MWDVIKDKTNEESRCDLKLVVAWQVRSFSKISCQTQTIMLRSTQITVLFVLSHIVMHCFHFLYTTYMIADNVKTILTFSAQESEMAVEAVRFTESEPVIVVLSCNGTVNIYHISRSGMSVLRYTVQAFHTELLVSSPFLNSV